MKSEKTCKNCIKGIRIHVNNDILCPLKGAVSPGYVCGRHKHISDSEPVFYKKNKCVHCANFLVNRDKENTYSTIGRCSLFSVRYFDGSQKNACSKFEHKQERDVSLKKAGFIFSVILNTFNISIVSSDTKYCHIFLLAGRRVCSKRKLQVSIKRVKHITQKTGTAINILPYVKRVFNA